MSVMVSKYNGRCNTCNLSFPAGTTIRWSRYAGASHAWQSQCDEAKAKAATEKPEPSAAPAATVNAAGIVDMLNAAKSRGLKFPKARFLSPSGSEMVLYIAGPMARVPGAVVVKVGHSYVGRIRPTGEVEGVMADDSALLKAMAVIASDPAAAAKAYGALMCRCSFCGLALTDEGSVEVGYGPVCAKHWGLPHRALGAKVLTVQVGDAIVAAEPRAAFENKAEARRAAALKAAATRRARLASAVAQ
jgi:hypothetical protein